jgi:SNF2 family DNA or RNA helicase
MKDTLLCFQFPRNKGCFISGIQLRSYQLDGVQWLTQCLQNQEGCILGDEMGLGKTCQVCDIKTHLFTSYIDG